MGSARTARRDAGPSHRNIQQAPPRVGHPQANAGTARVPACPCGGGCPRCRAPAAGPAAEQEADALAERVAGAAPEGAGADRAEDVRAPAPLPPSVNDTIARSGEAMPEPLSGELGAAVGHDLSSVRVHRDDLAARSALDVAADAYTVGRHIVFGQDRFAPQSATGRALLVHELAHVLQQSAAPQGLRLQRKPGRGRSRAPFDKVLKLNDEAALALAGFLSTLKALPDPSAPLTKRIDRIDELAKFARAEQEGAIRVVDAWIAGEPIPIDTPFDSGNYVLDDKPSAKGLAMIERRDTNLLALIDLVEPRVTRLARLGSALGADTPKEMREAFDTVAGYYLDTLPSAEQKWTFEQVRFLDTFYDDPRVIQGYGLWAYLRKQLPDLYENVLMSMAGAETTLVVDKELKGDDPRFSPGEIHEAFKGGMRERRTGELKRTINALRDMKTGEVAIGELPESLGQVGTVPDPETNAALIRLLVDVQVRVSVLHLWQPIQPLQELLYGTNNAGQSLIPFAKNERQRWLTELTDLQNEFADELKAGDHPGIEGRIDAWLKRLQPLIDAIPAEVRTKKIMAAVVEQIPFMFVAGATAVKMGLWVRAATQSKWIAALAEGATLTVMSAANMPAGSALRPKGVLGWTTNLAVNVLLSRVGRAFFDLGTSVAKGRSVIVAIGAQVVVPTVGMATLQTGVQLIEAKLRDSKGETGFTQLLTLNLVLSGIGMAISAATVQPASSSAGSTALAKPGAPEIAKRLGITEDHARLLLEVEDRLWEFKDAAEAVNLAAAQGNLTQAQVATSKKQGLDLADFLEAHCEPLAKSGAFGDVTPTQIKAALGSIRTKLQAVDFTSLLKVRALLPESTEGLVRVGSGEQWVYDRANPPRGLAALRADYEKQGNTVRSLPSGGFEASEPGGAVLAQIVPVNAQAAAVLGRSLASMAKGKLTSEGLAKVKTQTAVPKGLLEAQLEQAGATPAGAKAVPRVLQHLARFIDPTSETPWYGLSNYLSLGGDAALLARAMAYGPPNEFAIESRDLAYRLLTQMATWDAEAVEGFRQLYVLLPNLTAERLHRLVGGFKPVEVKGVFQSIALLAPRSKGLGKVLSALTSGAVPSERGAMGALTSGVQLAPRFPNATLVFEAPVRDEGGDIVRVTDISVQETRTTRVAGVEKTTTVEIAAVEVKEVTSAKFGKRALQQLARNIQHDSLVRSQKLAPAGGSRPFFETLLWRIRGKEIRQQAINALNDPKATEAQIDARMREIVERALRPALERPEFKTLAPEEQEGYRNAFKGVPFVEFF
jgi:hypothetical protein